MQPDYSLEQIMQEINDAKSAEYFGEVFSSYQNENYRSAIVMLWSVAVCDALFKLRHLVDMYGDQTAQNILNDVAKMQRKNPRSPEWEAKLFKWIADKTQLIDPSDLQAITHLQEDRNIAAHPILTGKLELHSPTREVVRAHMRSVLDGLLTKPALYSRGIFNEFIRDLAESSSFLIRDDRLQRYLDSRYLSRIRPAVELDIFESLWKLVFRTRNADCNTNREINFRALRLIGTRQKAMLANSIKNDNSFYSDINQDIELLKYLVLFLSEFPDIYPSLQESAQVILNHVTDTDPYCRLLGWFRHQSLSAHLNNIEKQLKSEDPVTLDSDAFHILWDFFPDPDDRKSLLKLASIYYGMSWSFDVANSRYSNFIQPYIVHFDQSDILNLLQLIEDNDQTYKRNKAKRDHKEVKEWCDKVLGKQFDYTPYPNFIEYL